MAPKLGENRGNAGKGRPPGVPNKNTQAIKDAIAEAFTKAGGVEYLVKLAETDPRTFCGLVGRVIPLQVGGDPENPLGVIFQTFYEAPPK